MTIAKLEKRYVFNHKETGAMARKARMKRKVSVTTLAKRMKVSRMYLYELERGQRNWREDLVERYQRALRR
jgi:transcriptional regulator with XRE-family HTH domain